MGRDFRGNRFSFDDIVGDTVVIVHVRDVNPPCRALLSLIEDVSKEFSRVDFVKLSYREHRYLENEVGLTGLPTVVLFKNGRSVDSFVGVPSTSELKSQLKMYY